MVAIEPIKIFYCYAPQDKKYRDKLETHLMILKRLGQITLRLNREILAGTDWKHVQDERFQMADLILLLVSPDFIASDYHYGIEMHHALEKHEAGNVWVTPVILRPTHMWQETLLGKLQALPKNGKSITEQRNYDAAFATVVKGISEVVAMLLTRKQELAFTTKVGKGKFPKFTRVIGPLCISCGARNPLGVITCENCGDLLLTTAAKISQKVHSPDQSEDEVTEAPFFLNPARPDLTDRSKCPYCGTNNLPDDIFCTNCGGSLDSSTVDQATRVSNAPVILSVASAGSTGETTTGADLTGSGTLTPDSRLQGGRYVIKKELGQGGMGAALLATDMRVAGKPVVIKELISDSTDPIKRQEDVRNFEREVETLAIIDHALVPNVTDHFQEGTHYFMVQEYVDGESLEDRMKRINGPMAEQEALNYASQVLDVLDYLSQLTPPIVHRDIKPANIIIGARDKRAHLVDFGIARADIAKNAKRKQTLALGTQGYAPPEQYRGNVDARSDLYALAATLHYLLTNRNPSEYPPWFAFPPVCTLYSQLSPNIERVLTRALTIVINKRYQNAAAMKQDIDTILLNHFGVSGHLSTYRLGMPGPMTTNVATPRQKPPFSPPNRKHS